MDESPPPPPPPAAPTTITALGDDILREIFQRLPDVTTLARAAFACRAFLRAVRSSPAFRRRFRELHAPPLLAIFRMGDMRAIIPTATGKGSDITDLLQNSYFSKWRTDPDLPYSYGYVEFFHRTTGQDAKYSPHSQALTIYPKNLQYGTLLEFYTLSPDGEEQQPSCVICVHHDCTWAWACVAVFSSHTMDWQVVLPKMDTGRLLPDTATATARVVGGFVCWVGQGCILALNTRTFHFFRMDLPPPLKVVPYPQFQLGQTKDGELFIVGVLKSVKRTLYVWLWQANDDGFGRFMLHKIYSLHANVSKVTECPDEADIRPMAVINGFVYLDVADFSRPWSPSWSLSFCLETALLQNHGVNYGATDPYIMVSWPSSLIRSKEDSEAGVAGNMSEDDGHIGTKEASPVLFSALQSFKEKLIDDGHLSFANIDSFLLDDEMNSLLKRITTFESGLAAARGRILRIRPKPNSMNVMELVRACSRLFTRRS